MPQKRNPDVLELGRARCRELRGRHAMIASIAGGLPSSYHRDFQLLKQPLFATVTTALSTITVLTRVIEGLGFDAAKGVAACSDDLFAAHEAVRRVGAGATFRDAYREVASELLDGSFKADAADMQSTHTGGLHALGLDDTAAGIVAALEEWDTRRAAITASMQQVYTK
jgi:argininosuccinate lyase